MLTNVEKIEMIEDRLKNIEAQIKSFTDNAEACKDKYSLEDELLICNNRKSALLQEQESLTNQG